jgi:hypothetical protein
MNLELTVNPDAAPDDFNGPTFATIIGSAPPEEPSPALTFGNITW